MELQGELLLESPMKPKKHSKKSSCRAGKMFCSTENV